jgi:GT2 family glycosyltransferase
MSNYLPLVGLVTVTYNSANVIEDFTKSVLCQDHVNFILYIVDSNSSDNTLNLLTKHYDKRIKVIPMTENVGFAKGTNIGILESINDNCDYVMMVNNDTLFDEHLLSVLLEQLEINQVDMVAPKMMYHPETNKIWCAGGGFHGRLLIANKHYGEGEVDKGQLDVSRLVDFVPMCCVLFRIELFRDNSVGLLDEKYFTYYEDTDWMWRAKLQHKKLMYISQAILYHKVSSLTGACTEFSINYMTRNRVYFIRKSFKEVQKYKFLSTYLFALILGFFIGKYPLRIFILKIKSFLSGLSLNVN